MMLCRMVGLPRSTKTPPPWSSLPWPWVSVKATKTDSAGSQLRKVTTLPRPWPSMVVTAAPCSEISECSPEPLTKS